MDCDKLCCNLRSDFLYNEKKHPFVYYTFFFYQRPSIIWSYSIRPLSWPMFPPPLFLPDRFILFCLLVLIMVSSREPQYVVLHAVNTLIDSQLTDRVKVISYTEKAIPLLLSTSRFFFWFFFVLVLMIWYTVYIQLSLNFSWELNLKKNNLFVAEKQSVASKPFLTAT